MYPTQHADASSARTAARPPFFDPWRCPDCQAPIGGRQAPGASPELRCARCGLQLAGPTASRLAGLLSEADRTLEHLRRQRAVATVQPAATGVSVWGQGAAGAASRRAAEASGPPQPPPVSQPTPAARRPTLSGAAILLGLGGLCLVVAAIVFLSVSWTSLSLGAKVAVLATVTGLLAGAAAEVSRRGLRGSAETLWTVTLVDLALDVWAARRAGLAGLDEVSGALFTSLAAGGIAVCALGCCLAVRRTRVARSLVGIQCVLGISGAVALGGVLGMAGLAAWVAVSMGVVTLVPLAVAARGAGLTVTAWIWALVATLLWLGLAITGLVRIGLGQFVPEVWHGQAWELPMAVLLALATAAVEPVVTARPVRIALTAAGLGLGSIMVAAIADGYLPLPAALAVALLAVAALTWWRQPIWRSASVLVLAANLAVDVLAVADAAAAGMHASIEPRHWLWLRPASHRLQGWQPEPVLAEVLLLAAVCLVLLARQRVLATPVLAGSARGTMAVTGLLAVAIALNAYPSVLVASMAWWAAAVATVAIATTTIATTAGTRSADERLLAVPAVALLLSLLTSLASDLATLVAFGAGAALTVAVRWLAGRGGRIRPPLLVATELAAIAQLFVAVAAGWHRVQPDGATAAVVGLVVCSGVFAVGAVSSSTRRWWAWPAFSLLTVAIWIEAAIHHLHAPEPYSLPSGALILAFGIWAGRRRPDLSSWLAWGPGLLVLSAPSLVLALHEPLSSRAAVLGVAALAIALAGARLRLQAPLLVGSAELAVLVVRELGPYALALPRWVSIATAGLLLLAVGVTWENRLTQLRQARHELAGMR